MERIVPDPGHGYVIGPTGATDTRSTAERTSDKVSEFFKHPVKTTKGIFEKANDYRDVKHQVDDLERILDTAASNIVVLDNEHNMRLKEGLNHIPDFRQRIKLFQNRLKDYGMTSSAESVSALKGQWSMDLQDMYSRGLDDIIMAVEGLTRNRATE